MIAKLEMLNPGGSVKDRPAFFIVRRWLEDGTIDRDTHLLESSSGNFAMSLAIAARVYGMTLTCVVDPLISPANLQMLNVLGANVEVVTRRDQNGGYLLTRIQRVQELLASIPNSRWVNQYANQLNWRAHYDGTAEEILSDLDTRVDCLVVAVSTTGTLMGVACRLREQWAGLRVVAVDAVGSVIFGGSSGARRLPGLGASRVPEILDPGIVDDIIHVTDLEAIEGCRSLAASEGILAGASSGAIVVALQRIAAETPRPYRLLTIFPDRGERYLDTVYSDPWVADYRKAQAELRIELSSPRDPTGPRVAGRGTR